MGVVYTAVNQADVIAKGDADALLWMKVPLNFLAPFVVANVGLLGSRRRTPDDLSSGAHGRRGRGRGPS
jgi:hypothetical protein